MGREGAASSREAASPSSRFASTRASKETVMARPTRQTQPKITNEDLERIQEVLDNASEREAEVADALDDELSRALVVPREKIPAGVVTLNSRVVYESLPGGEEREVTLVCPNDAHATANRISVLAPLGAALLGLSEQDEIRWPVSTGKELHVRIKQVVYQPEAAGDAKQP